MNYITNCTVAKGEDIQKMCDSAKEITYQELLENITEKQIFKLFPFYKGIPLKIENDYCVNFYKGKYKGKACVFIEHSRIEYIFTN